MKRRLLALAAAAPCIAAPVLMTAAERPAAPTPTELTRPLDGIRVASRGPIVTPATKLPADASLLEIPDLESLGIEEPAADADVQTDSHAKLNAQIAILEKAAETLAGIDGYTAELTKQERIDGLLNDAETTRIKVTHDGFGIYMKWTSGDRGREVLFVQGQNDGDMLVHPGGWKGRFLPTLSVDPHGSLAQSQSRHAVSDAGLRNLIRKHLEHRAKDFEARGVTHSVRETTFDDRPVTELETVYTDAAYSPEYSRTVLLIDDETGLPVASRNYGWTAIDRDGDEAKLVERYEYRDIDTAVELTAADFDRGNKRYCFR